MTDTYDDVRAWCSWYNRDKVGANHLHSVVVNREDEGSREGRINQPHQISLSSVRIRGRLFKVKLIFFRDIHVWVRVRIILGVLQAFPLTDISCAIE